MPPRRQKPEFQADILLRIVASAQGVCACGTLESELSWHHPNCLWRVRSEAAFEIERLRTALAEAEAAPVTTRRKKALDRRQASLMLPVKGGKTAKVETSAVKKRGARIKLPAA
jgi:hypothetical protein